MDPVQSIALRNRIIGLLVKRARLKAGKSQRDCADYLGCSPFLFTQCEQGRRGLSLPQLEALAHFFGVPLDSLWDESFSPVTPEDTPELPIEQLMAIRRKEIAVHFRQCRQKAELTQEAVAQMLDRSAYIISQYEHGRRDIPLAELEAALELCGQRLTDLLGEEPLLAAPIDRERETMDRLKELDPEVREFVLKPTNQLYLRIAMILSTLKADQLRRIAELILDITY